MRVNLKIDSVALFARIRNGSRRLKYGVVNAINATLLDAQRDMWDRERRVFTIRKPIFFFGTPGRPGGVGARIKPFASVGQARAYGEIAAEPSTLNSKRRTLLPEFEAGGRRSPVTPGARTIAIPLLGRPARPALNRGVPPQYTFAGLRFKAYRPGRRKAVRRRTTRSGFESLHGEFGRRLDATGTGRVQWKGRERTFILKHSARAPEGGVFQRIGPGREDVRLVYKFQSTVRLDARLGFERTVRQTADLRFRQHMEEETVNALARGGLA